MKQSGKQIRFILFGVLFVLSSCGSFYNIETAETISKHTIGISAYINPSQASYPDTYLISRWRYNDNGESVEYDTIIQNENNALLYFDMAIKLEYGLRDNLTIGIALENTGHGYMANVKYNYFTSKDSFLKCTMSLYGGVNRIYENYRSILGGRVYTDIMFPLGKVALPNTILLSKKLRWSFTVTPLFFYVPSVSHKSENGTIQTNKLKSIQPINYGMSANTSIRLLTLSKYMVLNEKKPYIDFLIGYSYINFSPLQQFIFSSGMQIVF